MPHKLSSKPKPIEDFFFAMEDWQFQHARSVRLDKRMRERWGPLYDWAEITLRGSLRHTTKRRFDRGCLRVWPREDRDPPEDVRSVGVVMQVHEGEIEAVHTVDPAAFQRLLTVATAGHLVEFSFRVQGLFRNSGVLVEARLGTERTDEEDMPERRSSVRAGTWSSW